MSSDKRMELGKAAEAAAADFLMARGFTIIERNYRKRRGEIDIIARKGDTIHFIEIKARSDASGFSATESWSPMQRERFIALAEGFLAERRGLAVDDNPDVSLDFMGLTFAPDNAILDIEFIEDALRPE